MRTRARRSVVDHSLGMGEAPGSNPGESMLLLLRSFLLPVAKPQCGSGLFPIFQCKSLESIPQTGNRGRRDFMHKPLPNRPSHAS